MSKALCAEASFVGRDELTQATHKAQATPLVTRDISWDCCGRSALSRSLILPRETQSQGGSLGHARFRPVGERCLWGGPSFESGGRIRLGWLFGQTLLLFCQRGEDGVCLDFPRREDFLLLSRRDGRGIFDVFYRAIRDRGGRRGEEGLVERLTRR